MAIWFFTTNFAADAKFRNKKHITIFTEMKHAIFASIAIAASAFCCNAQSLYVSSMKGNVNLRTAPSTTAAKAGTLSKADLLPCLEEIDGWYKVDLDGKEAYVSQSVATTCDAVIPEEMFKKDLTSNGPLDKTRFQGSINIEPIDRTHALITVNWMRVNLPAEDTYYLAEIKDGRITATHGGATYVDSSSPLASIKEELGQLDKPIPVGFDEFNNTIYFDGAEYSEFE